MKKLLLLLLPFIPLFINAQTTVNITYSSVTNSSSCTVPQDGYFYYYGLVTGYLSTDIPNFHVDFGDGNFTDIQGAMYYINSNTYEADMGSITHTYNTAGIFPVTCILTLPDGNADTLYSEMMITNVCNNVTGRLYEDVNNNCVYDGGDIPMQGEGVQLNYNSSPVSTTNTDSQGMFTLNALPGYTYNLLTDTSTGTPYILACSATQGMTITPSPNATQDIPVADSTGIHISYADDSASFFNGNCVPLSGYFYTYGSTMNYFSPNDSVDVYYNFGDGHDTTVTVEVYNSAGPNGNYWSSMPHTYTAAGSYNVLYKATGPDGRSDAVIHYNDVNVTDTCGNIQGDVYIDNNNNCVFDAGDSAMAWIYISVVNTTSGWASYAFTDANGHYSFEVAPGSYTVTVQNYWANYQILTPTCPASASTSATVTAANSVNADFAFVCSGSHDFTGSFGLWPGIYPNYTTHIHPYIWAVSCTSIPGSVTFTLDPLVQYMGVCDTTFNPTVNGNTITWNFNSTNAYYNWYYWWMSSGCIEVRGDPTLQLGDTVCFTMTINPIAGDVTPADNTITRCIPALVSYDPNTKEVSPRGVGPQGDIPQLQTLNYTINFQNTGSAPAHDIFVLDTLDADLDLSTLFVTGSDHYMETQLLPGNVLRFNFPNIDLPDSASDQDGSHAWVSYRITPKNNLANGTQITNTAGIYFDFNPPVFTNATLNTIYDPASVHEIVEGDVSIYPNPASSTFEIKFANETNATLHLTDLAGKEVMNSKVNGMKTTIDVSTLPVGVYLLKVESPEGTSVHKIIVQR